MLRNTPISYLVALLATGIILAVSALYACSVSSAVSELTVDVAGQSLDVVADRVEEALQQSIRERMRDLDQAIVAASKHSGAVHQALANWIHHDSVAGEAFEWVGLFDINGAVIAQTASGLPANDTAFRTALATTGAEVVKPFAAVSSVEAGGTSRLTIDLLVPVSDGASLTGFVGARVDASFVQGIAGGSQGYGDFSAPPDLIVVDSQGHLILAPASVNKVPERVRAAVTGSGAAKPFMIADWPDGQTYITGFSNGARPAGIRSPSWSILVRQPAAVQLAPLVILKNRIWLYATFFVLHGILFAWVISSLVCRPLLRLAQAADAIRDGKSDAAMPVESSCREAQLLSNSLASLVDALKERERAQTVLAASLDEQVKQRTLELSHTNECLKSANQRAQEAITSKTRFLASASHDLRQPLQSLVLVTRQLVRRFRTGDDAQLMLRMEQSITSLSRMFNQLLDLSRLDTGIVKAHMTRVYVAGLLDRIADDARSDASARGLRFKFVGSEYVVSCDAVILETIVRNLLSNAIKFTECGGILLGARAAGSYVDICVYDTGPGIADEKIPELFKEFYRAPRQADAPNPGLGLGLSIVRRYADLIGAEVFVQSKVGRGSCFCVRVPRVAASAAYAPATQSFDEADFWKQRRIVVVEDDRCVRTALAAELEERGASVTSFCSAKSASGAIDHGLDFDVVIADYDLQDDEESGLLFINRLRTRQGKPFSPLILTGRTDAPTIKVIEAAGTPWLAKPATTHAMAALLQRKPCAKDVSMIQAVPR